MGLFCLGIGAHPDDMEILAGGLLALLARCGKAVGILDLTRGELGSNGTPARRAREAAAAAKALGLSVRRNLNLPDSGLEDTMKHRRLVAAAIRTLRPEVVVTMPECDHHPDHVAAARLVFGASWLSGLKRARGLRGTPHRPRLVLHAIGHRASEPDLIVDISGSWPAKLAAMRCYASQFTGRGGHGGLTFIDRPGFLGMIEARARMLGMRIGAAHGEAFASPLPLAVRDPVAALSGGGAFR